MNGNVKATAKNKGTSNKKTLDMQHSSHVKNLYEMKNKIFKLRQEIKNIDDKWNVIESKKRNGEPLTDHEINLQLELLDKKLDLDSEIRKSENEFDEIQYHTNTADILFKYYDLIEKGQKTPVDNDYMTSTSNNQNSILKYFFGMGCNNNTSNTKNTENDKQDDLENSRGNLLEKYMSYTDNNFVKQVPKGQCDETCCHCGSKNITVMTNDGYTFCNDCHTMEYIIIDHDKPSYRDPPKEISYFAYKRINHFPYSVRVLEIGDHFHTTCLLFVIIRMKEKYKI